MNDRSLAQACFDAQGADEKLFKAVSAIAPDVEDCWVDDYDSSVEVILEAKAPPLDKGMVEKILALGFQRVYESPAGVCWCGDGSSHKCSPSLGGSLPIWRHRVELEDAKAEIATLKHKIALLESWVTY